MSIKLNPPKDNLLKKGWKQVYPIPKPVKKVNKVAKPAKYKNTRCQCKLGHIHLSRGEARYCEELELRRKSGEFKSFEVEKCYRLEINGKLICKHKPDFTIYPTANKNNFWIEEYKGFPTDLWKMKKKIFEAIYPRVEYVVVWHK